MFGGLGEQPLQQQQDETEVEKLRRELREANERIERLRDALGSNHPLGRLYGIFG